jgi:hypothetical protein
MAGLRRIGPDIPVQFVTAPGDQALAAVAERQYGVIAHAQLRALGLSKSTIGDRVRAGRLHPVHRGVYAVGHGVLGIRGRWLAAVLACGPTAVLSHASAAALWELRGTAAAKIDVTVRTAGGRSRPALRIHRPRTLHDEELTTRHGIPVTTPARTLLDLAATLTRRQLERALDQAEVLELLDARSLDAVARAHPNHHGTTSLSAALQAHHPGTTLTRSELEEAMLALCRAHDLPGPAERPRRGPRGRLPLPHGPPRRRDGRLALPPHAPRLRERPPARRHARARRLPRPALHAPPGRA